MPNTKEKLIELICSTEYGNGSLIGNNFQKGFIEKIADHNRYYIRRTLHCINSVIYHKTSRAFLL